MVIQPLPGDTLWGRQGAATFVETSTGSGSMRARLRAALQREMTRQNKGGAFLAMLTCPCHAVMLVFALTGTAAGSWLAARRAYLYLGFTLAFLLGLWLMARRTAVACADGTCDVPAPKPGAAPQPDPAVDSSDSLSRPTLT